MGLQVIVVLKIEDPKSLVKPTTVKYRKKIIIDLHSQQLMINNKSYQFIGYNNR